MKTGEKIRGIRLLKGLSQENMATMLGLSRNAYSEIERGISDVSESRLEQIARELGVSAKDIHNFDERKNMFFESCTGLVGVNIMSTYNQADSSDIKSLQTRVEFLELVEKNLRLEIEKLNLEKQVLELKLNTRI